MRSASSVPPHRFRLANLLMLLLLLCLAPSQVNAQAQPVSIAVGGDNLTRLLWNNPDGNLSLWKIAADGSVATQNSYGPYTGWSGKSLAAGTDNVSRILWTNTNGTAALWRISPDGSFTNSDYGPYPGWTALNTAVGGDNVSQVHDGATSLALDSTKPQGNGRAVDDIIADVRLQSLDYANAYKLRNFASANPAPNPGPAFVAEPQFTWTQSGSVGSAFGSASGDVQGKTALFSLGLYPMTGTGVTIGFKMKVQATPNTVNAQGQADLPLTLYDNSNADPTLLSSTLGIFQATAALYPKVAKYNLNFSALSLWVKFTKIPTPVWRQVGPAYASPTQPINNTLYAILSTPVAPMAQPWVGVLDKACDWAKGTSNSASATTATAITKGFYDNSDYQPGYPTFTTFDYTNGVLVRDFRVNTFISNGLAGPCYDFAAFMVCLSNSIGAVNLQMQTQDNSFVTKPATRANIQMQPGSNLVFANHAWSNGSGKIFDAAIKFGGVTNPTNLDGPDVGTSYYNGLVSQPPR